MLRLLLAVVVSSGCGRIAFDPNADGAPGGLQTTCSTVELCNGIDDTCDNVIDEGCACTPYNIDTGIGAARSPVFTGSGVTMLVAGGAETGLVSYDVSGVAQPGPPPYPGQSVPVFGMRWTGTRLVVLAKSAMEISLSWIEGGLGTPFVTVVNDEISSAFGFGSRGEENAIVWVDPSTSYMIQWFDGSGAALSPRMALIENHSTALWDIEIVARTDGWGVSWSDYHMSTDAQQHVHVAVFDNQYRLLHTNDLGGDTTTVGLVPTRTGYAFLGLLAGQLQLVEFDATGVITSGPTPIAAPAGGTQQPKVAWTDDGYRGIWVGSFGIGTGVQDVTARIASNGAASNIEAIGPDVSGGGSAFVGEALSSAGRAVLVWTVAVAAAPQTLHLTQRCP